MDGSNTNSDAVVDRLDQLILLMRVVFHERISAFWEELRTDAVTAAILDLLGGDPVAAGEVKRTIAMTAGVSEKTVQRALVRLVDRGVVRAHGRGTATTYSLVGML